MKLKTADNNLSERCPCVQGVVYMVSRRQWKITSICVNILNVNALNANYFWKESKRLIPLSLQCMVGHSNPQNLPLAYY